MVKPTLQGTIEKLMLNHHDDDDEVLFPTYIESQGWSLTFKQKKPQQQAAPPIGRDENRAQEYGDAQISNNDLMRERKESGG